MNLTITANHIELTKALEDYAKVKFEKVWKHFDVVSAHIRMGESDGGNKLAKADIQIKGKTLHIEEKDSDLYAAIDKLAEASHLSLKKAKEKKAPR